MRGLGKSDLSNWGGKVSGRDGAVQPLRAVLVHALQTHVYMEPMRHSLKMHQPQETWVQPLPATIAQVSALFCHVAAVL